MSMNATYRRSLIAVIGTTAGVTSLAVGSAGPASAAAARPDDSSASTSILKGPTPTPAPADMARGTCFSWTNVRGTLNTGVNASINVPTTARGNNVRDCLLREGNQTDGVYKLQDAINKCYPQFSSGVGSDGNYGSNTARAVRQIQSSVGLNPDGVYGPDTKTAMRWPAYWDGTNNQIYTCALLRN